MKWFSSLFLLILCSLIVASCSKDSNSTETNNDNNNTSTGAGTMSAKVDGATWTASLPGSSAVTATYNESQHYLTVIGTNFVLSGGNSSSITLTISKLLDAGIGEYRLGVTSTDVLDGTGTYTNITTSKPYATADGEQTGTVKITTFDKSKKIASGTFSFKARADETGVEKVTITEGKFDAKWQ